MLVPLYAIGKQAIYDPGTLSLTGWWRGSYSGSPWTGTASAGSSGSRNIQEPSGYPDVGTAVNGFTPATFVAANFDRLECSVTAANLISTTAYTVSFLIKPNTSAALGSPNNLNPTIIGENGTNWGIIYANSNIRLFHTDSVSVKTSQTAVFTGSWVCVDCRYNGSQIQTRVNGGSWTSTTAGTLNSVSSQTIRVGVSNDYSKYYDGSLMELMITNTSLADATLDSIRGYYNARYGLSL